MKYTNRHNGYLVPSRLLGLLCMLVLSNQVSAQAHSLSYPFTASWSEQWQFSEANQSCELSKQINEYGEVRFVASPAHQPAFELQAYKDWHEPGPIAVSRFAPGWHPDAGLYEDLGNLKHVEGGGAIARDRLAGEMLLALRQGLHLQISAPTWVNPRSEVSLEVTAKDLRPALVAFLACAHTDVKVSWQEMSRTRISYDVDQHDLDDAGRGRLRSLAQYVLQDKGIEKIYVDGHTDASGTERGNRKLAKRRAEEVAKYLRQCGLQSEQIVVRYHGASYPVADNKSVSGKAQNRRTTVRLERAPAQSIAKK